MSTFKLHTGVSLAVLTFAAALNAPAARADAPPEEAAPLQWDEIVVTGTPVGRTVGESIVGTTVLTGEELESQLAATIGETLSRQPGITSTFFGPGASRPVVRGLAGPRIRVLDNGIGSIDASDSSVDHAVAVEPVFAERIEIIRGASTLRYGSSAAGGVVNVIDGRIPTVAPEGGIDLGVRYGYTTVDEGNEVAGALDLTVLDLGESKLVFHADAFFRDADDYEIPGFAESATLRALEEEEHGEEEDHDEEEHGEEEEAFGIVENSDIESKGGSGALSFIFANGHIGFSGRVFQTNYGIPGGHEHAHGEEEHGEEDHDEEHGEEEEEEEGAVRIDLDQVRLDFDGALNGDFGLFQTATLRIGYADYEHVELEGDEIGTRFTNKGWEGRFELLQKEYAVLNGAQLNGAFGTQIRTRDFAAKGEEAFVPPTKTLQLGVFTYQELDTGPWLLDFGARYEYTRQDASNLRENKTFDAFSVSAGAGFRPAEGYFVGASVYRTERAPSTEELFSNGPHIATNAFEIGNPNFDEEKALGIEGTVKGQIGWMFAQVNAYYTDYTDFIFETPTGEEEDGLPVFEFRAEDATFAGFEAETEIQFPVVSMDYLGDVGFFATGSIDFVDASIDVSGNDNLPRIPPLSGLVGAGFRSEYLDFRVEGEFVAEQDEVTEFELPTGSYALLNIYAAVHPFGSERDISLDIRATNLTDEEARLHTSFLKDLLPLPGRNVKVYLKAAF